MILSKCLPAIIFSLALQASSFSQAKENGKGKITGTVLDSETGKPVEFASIALFLKISSGQGRDSLITGVITSSNGNFKLEQIPFGQFRIEISFIGYKALQEDNIVISPGSREINLGRLSLIPNSELLREVEVVGEKRMVEMAIDKKVFNVDKNITSAGGSATDVLQNVPSVSVDIDGNISLRGSGNVTVLIDGRPSGLTGASRSAILQQIPASSIESIEVITNPSVKYDPDGMSGIINIILKKNQAGGANGSITAGIGTRDKYNASANLNYRNGKINAYASYSFRYNPHYGKGTMMRENFFTDSTWYLNQYSNSQRTPLSNMVKTGVDFFLNHNNTLGISAMYNRKNDLNEETIEYQNLDYLENLTGLSFRNIEEKDNADNLDITANYKHTFQKPKQNLTMDISHSSSMEVSDEKFSQQEYYTNYSPAPLNPELQNTFNDRKYQVTTIQSDYSHPFHEKSKFETGYKSIIRDLENEFIFENFNYSANDWLSDSLRNNHYIYREQVHAAYGTYANAFGKLSFQAGLRLEQAFTSSEQLLNNTVNKRDYFSFFPGGHFSYQLSKSNELQLSYSKRINRPSIGSLIAWMDYDDPLNIRLGNPDLKPEYIHSVELSHALQNEKHTLTSSVYYRQVVDMIQRFRTVDAATGVATIRFENYAGAINTGFEFVSRNELFKWWGITSNLNFYRSIINATNIESDLHNEGLSWSAKMTSNFNFPANLQVQLSGHYRAPAPVAIGTMNAMYGLDLGIKKDILKGKGSINLNISDIFNTRQFGIDIAQTGYQHHFTRKRETRIGTLNFTYKFGKSESRQKQKGKGDGENQQIRGEDLF